MDEKERAAKFYENKRIVEERKSRTTENYNESSKQRLESISCKKIDTTMIGAISAAEVGFNELIASAKDEETKIQIRNVYDKVRSKILDNGNKQKRSLSNEFSQYTITWNRYTIVMPVKNRNEEGIQ